MNKKVIALLLGVVALAVVAIIAVNLFSKPDTSATEIRTTEQVIENPTPAVQPRANTFGIMTAEEKAAAEAAAAKRAAEQASSTASSTATTSDPSEAS